MENITTKKIVISKSRAVGNRHYADFNKGQDCMFSIDIADEKSIHEKMAIPTFIQIAWNSYDMLRKQLEDNHATLLKIHSELGSSVKEEKLKKELRTAMMNTLNMLNTTKSEIR